MSTLQFPWTARFCAVAQLLAVVLSLWTPAAESAESCPIEGKFPVSGQTTAYTAILEGRRAVAVPDDGTVQAGAALRFRNLGDGTIRDGNTKLIWEKKSMDGGLHDVNQHYIWSNDSSPGAAATIWDWLAQVNAEGGTGFAGMSDWRIPNLKELQSLIDFENEDPAVAPAFNDNCTDSCSVLTCSCTSGDRYWSSTTAAVNPGWAWSIAFIDGFTGISQKTSMNFNVVRAVRGGCME